jgi:hypothetical protein
MLFRRKVGYGVNGIALLEALRPKRDLPMASRLLPRLPFTLESVARQQLVVLNPRPDNTH